jgi:hypothetical protein
MPEIAFDPDIKGVCNVEGTLEISSKPRKMARIKIYKREIKVKKSMGHLLYGF